MARQRNRDVPKNLSQGIEVRRLLKSHLRLVLEKGGEQLASFLAHADGCFHRA